MNDPRYVYQPRSASQRARLSLAHRRRLGIPDGCARVYGRHVPVELAADIRKLAARVAQLESFAEAGRFVDELSGNDWEVVRHPPAISSRRPSHEEIVALWLCGERTIQDVASETGYNYHTVRDILWREGVARRKRRPPKGCHQIPLSECRKMVAATLGHEKEDDRARDFRTGVIVLAALFEEIWPRKLAAYTGYSFAECLTVYNVMVANRLWRNGEQDSDRYLEGDGGPGLQMGDMRLVLEVLLCMGQVQWDRKADTWRSASCDSGSRAEH